jgi:hypothetical protein
MYNKGYYNLSNFLSWFYKLSSQIEFQYNSIKLVKNIVLLKNQVSLNSTYYDYAE